MSSCGIRSFSMGIGLVSSVLFPVAHSHLSCLLVVLRKILTVGPRPGGAAGSQGEGAGGRTTERCFRQVWATRHHGKGTDKMRRVSKGKTLME
jgi:hypothetical protein